MHGQLITPCTLSSFIMLQRQFIPYYILHCYSFDKPKVHAFVMSYVSLKYHWIKIALAIPKKQQNTAYGQIRHLDLSTRGRTKDLPF